MVLRSLSAQAELALARPIALGAPFRAAQGGSGAPLLKDELEATARLGKGCFHVVEKYWKLWVMTSEPSRINRDIIEICLGWNMKNVEMSYDFMIQWGTMAYSTSINNTMIWRCRKRMNWHSIQQLYGVWTKTRASAMSHGYLVYLKIPNEGAPKHHTWGYKWGWNRHRGIGIMGYNQQYDGDTTPMSSSKGIDDKPWSLQYSAFIFDKPTSLHRNQGS